MAHGDYYNPANKSVTDGTVVYADDINKINTAIDSALEQVAYDLDVIEADLEAGGLSAKNWATEDQGTRPDPILDLYSAKAYALEAKGWASAAGTITEASTGAALAGSASAKTKAAEAAASALAASGFASSAAGSASIATNKAGEALNSANAAALSETNAGNSAIAAAASAANLPNATTAGANKLLTTNSSGNGWEYIDSVGVLATRPRKNLLINGGFDVWQRGTSFTGGTNQYTADRWYLRGLVDHGNIIVTKTDADPLSGVVPAAPNFFLTLSVGAFEGASIAQRIEYLPQFSDKTLTCSFWICRLHGDGELDVQLNAHFGTGGTPTAYTRPLTGTPSGIAFPSGAWFEQRTVTMDVPDLSGYSLGTDTNTSYLEVEISFLNAVGYGSACMISGVQLEFGDTATDFEYRHPAEELMLCQRYYEKGTQRGVMVQYNASYATSQSIEFKVTKRSQPTVTLGNPDFLGHDGTPGVWYTHAYETTERITPLVNWTGGTTGRSFLGAFTWAADAEL